MKTILFFLISCFLLSQTTAERRSRKHYTNQEEMKEVEKIEEKEERREEKGLSTSAQRLK